MEDKDLFFNIGAKIKYLRNKQHLSQEKLAEMSDLSMTTVSTLENGHSDIKISTLNHIAKALNVELTALLDFRFN